jgi:hypothetical protein
MRQRIILFSIMSLALLFAVCGCSAERRQTFDAAMRSTFADLRSGDIESASSSLAIARSNADDASQKRKVEQVGILISGADAYSRGDRSGAGAAWSEAEAPEIRQALVANQSTLGVAITPTRTK